MLTIDQINGEQTNIKIFIKNKQRYAHTHTHIYIYMIPSANSVLYTYFTTNVSPSLLLLLSTPLHQRAASRVQQPNHVAANSLSPQVARKGSTLSGFVRRSRLEREVGRDLHSNKWEEV